MDQPIKESKGEVNSLSSANNNYLKEDDYTDVVKNVKFDIYKLTPTDSYNEIKIKEKIKNHEVCFGIALHFAIVGVGSKNYGNITINGNECDLVDLMTKNNIGFKNNLNTKLQDDDLTPRRLTRFYRFVIRKFLMEKKDVESYLHRKFVPNKLKNERTRTMIFPGMEHGLKPGVDDDIAAIFYQAYKNLDDNYNNKNVEKMNITDRITRVFQALGFKTEIFVK